ncbi:hypothetical protein CAOG_06096 [Capsaspora owczarzaki ATCC 30864]|uniref:SH3 domain-containing protein n=1 Tax=Capsaspora owczarzaki (strain ATCC 30864) TaxID=595528 RepID=A0A0D2WTC9_CAPO3|nr:hypothetical protein CAOG_06096 [Capsaspora owczarzaki ATCC 30864]KJE95670.1 hypothetical protein CAOG_006096 [Capsaspora owczarzaki ATCC 30864]|eukprot:XP_004345686.2 hypothetical protein CAOG_06096 [Capsaspora owczarzaki ATCC 30864]
MATAATGQYTGPGTYRVSYSFHPQTQGELQLSVGDFVQVQQMSSRGWVFCTARNGRTGYAPLSFLSPVAGGSGNMPPTAAAAAAGAPAPAPGPAAASQSAAPAAAQGTSASSSSSSAASSSSSQASPGRGPRSLLNGNASTVAASRGLSSLPDGVAAPSVPAIALFAFEGQDVNELSIQTNDQLLVTPGAPGGWWLASNSAGQFGYLPANYVKVTGAAGGRGAPPSTPKNRPLSRLFGKGPSYARLNAGDDEASAALVPASPKDAPAAAQPAPVVPAVAPVPQAPVSPAQRACAEILAFAEQVRAMGFSQSNIDLVVRQNASKSDWSLSDFIDAVLAADFAAPGPAAATPSARSASAPVVRPSPSNSILDDDAAVHSLSLPRPLSASFGAVPGHNAGGASPFANNFTASAQLDNPFTVPLNPHANPFLMPTSDSARPNGAASPPAPPEAEAPNSHLRELNQLREEIQKLRDQETCIVCMDAAIQFAFVPCGHYVCCDINGCASSLVDKPCPLCRALVTKIQRIYKST